MVTLVRARTDSLKRWELTRLTEKLPRRRRTERSGVSRQPCQLEPLRVRHRPPAPSTRRQDPHDIPRPQRHRARFQHLEVALGRRHRPLPRRCHAAPTESVPQHTHRIRAFQRFHWPVQRVGQDCWRTDTTRRDEGASAATRPLQPRPSRPTRSRAPLALPRRCRASAPRTTR